MKKIYNPYIPQIEKFENSIEFSYLAEFFRTNGVYTLLPANSTEYKKFWNDVKEKCINGYTNSKGIRITGHHFFYLNFCRINGFDPVINRKTEIFPRFIDLDYEYFHMIEYCEKNEKSLIAVKGRRQGWSYKAAAVCSHEYTFFPNSSAIIGTFYSSFSLETMKMVTENLNWLNANTEFRKQRNPDLKDYVLSRYQADVDGVKIWKGYKSSIRAISFKDNPSAAVGKFANKLIFDEAGVFSNITDTYGYTEPLIKSGARYTGIAIIFGSSGDMNSGSRYFYEMFTNPSKYNLLEFEDPDNPSKSIGFFSSAVMGHEGMCLDPNSKWFKHDLIDENGNSHVEASFDHIMFIREKAKGGLDPKALHAKVTQYPLNWQEAFLRNKGAIFSSPEMLEWLAELETTPSLRDKVEKGELVWKDGILEFRPNDELNYITSFPLKPDEDNTGCIAIWERPEYSQNEIPYSLYIASCDPIDLDKIEGGSLGSFFVYKRFHKVGSTHDIIVAEYTGRPKYADDFYENCRKLCIYYNAKCLYENNLKGFKNYFLQKNSLHYLWEQPDHMIKDIIKDSKVQRGYGVHMTRGSNGSSGIKDMCELYTKDWLYTEIHDDEEGKKQFNFQRIYSIPLLKELIAYDGEINTDRAMAFQVCILQLKELHKIHIETLVENKTLYGKDPYLDKLWVKKTVYKNMYKQLHN